MRRAAIVVAGVALAVVAALPARLTGSPPSADLVKVADREFCAGPAGAGRDARHVTGPVEYVNRDVVVENVVFAGVHTDDLVRVYGGHVVFRDVTFRGTGISASGHSLEVKRGGSVEVYNSKWAGAPAEDSVQFAGHRDSLIKCSVFASSPGEDHIDIKPSRGAVVDIIGNEFRTPTPGAGLQNMGTGGVQNFIGNTMLADNVFYETGSGVIRNNTIATLQIYGAHSVRVVGNTVERIKQGEWGTSRVPEEVVYRGNRVGEFEFNGGTCTASGNTGTADFSPCRAAPGTG